MNRFYIRITALVSATLACALLSSCSYFIKPAEKPSSTAAASEASSEASAETKTASSTSAVTEPDTSEPEEDLSRSDYMTVAHRGYSGEYPESTLEAFNGAFKKGFDGIECDVWETKAGSFLIQHDPTTTRTTGKRNYIWNLNKKTKFKYPIKYGANIKKYKNKKLYIPSLEQVLRVVKKNNGRLFLHIKNNSKYRLSKKGVKRIVTMLREYKLKDKTLIFGGMDYVNPFAGKGFKTGLFATPKSRKQVVMMANWCRKNKVNTMVFANMRSIRAYRYDKGIAKFLKGKNLDFGVYKASSHKQYEFYRGIGAWFSMSDNYVA